MVVGHSIQFTSPADSDFFANPVFATIYSFHMPLFALISGYLLYSPLRRRGPRSETIRRMRTVLVPFAAWTLILAALIAVAAGTGGHPLHVARGIARNVALLLSHPGGSLWFLWTMFVCGAITALLALRRRGLAVALFSLAAATVYVLPMEGFASTMQVQWLLPFFLAGYAAFPMRARLATYEAPLTVVALIAFVSLRLLWQRDDTVYLHHMQAGADVSTTLVSFGYRYGIAFAGIGATVGIVRFACRHTTPKILAQLGLASLGIYAVQTVLFRFIAKLPPIHDEWLRWLFVCVVAVAVLATSLAATKAIQRWRFGRRVLLGGR